jgi:hypothetical protein
VDITTAGAVVVGAYPAAGGEADLFVWGAVQTGGWYGDSHRAAAGALEAGYQWLRVRWRPWLRTGLFYASGDGNPGDARHGTFFPMLPTVRRFAQTTAYGTMNLRDLFLQVQARPRSVLGLRLDVRRLDLASPRDLWYAGSGATLARGGTFGYTGRRSNGHTRLGAAIEASADWALTRRVSLNAFAGHLRGGPVVTGTFAGRRLWFTYLESAIALDPR